MTYIVNENCVKCKLTDCVEVCPVDCFYEGENMLVIDPDECSDCCICEPECSIEAIVPDNEYTQTGDIDWAEFNLKYSPTWPNITDQKDPMSDHKSWEGVEGKEEHVSTEPAS